MSKCAQCGSQCNLRRCTRCLEVWYCSRQCQTKHWKQHKNVCGKQNSTDQASRNTGNKEPAMENLGQTVKGGKPDKCVKCKTPSTKLRRCLGCEAVYYCSKTCQTAHWPEHKTQCKNKDAAQSSAEASKKCSLCNLHSPNLLRCKGCMEVWYCNKNCQTMHWAQHKSVCKRADFNCEGKNASELGASASGKDKRSSDSNEPSQSAEQASARGKGDSGSSRKGAYVCMNCGHRGKDMKVCSRCQQEVAMEEFEMIPGMPSVYLDYQSQGSDGMIYIGSDMRGGPLHPPINKAARKAEAEQRSVQERRLAAERRENCRLQNQQDGIHVTPVLTWDEARSRAELLFPGKRIVDKFSDLDDDRLFMPFYQNTVSISRVAGLYEFDVTYRVARRLKDADGKESHVTFHNEEDPMPYFRYEQLTAGNFLCIDHAHLHVFMDKTVGFRVDYPWDVLVLEP